MDECGGKTKHKAQKVLTFEGIPARRETAPTPPHISLVAIHDFNGVPVPPIIISPHVKYPPREILEETDKIWGDCRLACSESGYITANIFYFTIKHIVNWFQKTYSEKPTKRKPIILICDCHSSRLNTQNLKEFAQWGVVVFLGTPNATHLYQVLDDLPFQQYQLKKATNKENMVNSNNIKCGVVEEAKLCIQSLKEVMLNTNQYTLSALKNCGFIPWNPKKLDTHSHLSWLMIELDLENMQPSNKKRKTNFDLLQGGAIATSRVFIEELEKQKQKRSKN